MNDFGRSPRRARPDGCTACGRNEAQRSGEGLALAPGRGRRTLSHQIATPRRRLRTLTDARTCAFLPMLPHPQPIAKCGPDLWPRRRPLSDHSAVLRAGSERLTAALLAEGSAGVSGSGWRSAPRPEPRHAVPRLRGIRPDPTSRRGFPQAPLSILGVSFGACSGLKLRSQGRFIPGWKTARPQPSARHRPGGNLELNCSRNAPSKRGIRAEADLLPLSGAETHSKTCHLSVACLDVDWRLSAQRWNRKVQPQTVSK